MLGSLPHSCNGPPPLAYTRSARDRLRSSLIYTTALVYLCDRPLVYLLYVKFRGRSFVGVLPVCCRAAFRAPVRPRRPPGVDIPAQQ